MITTSSMPVKPQSPSAQGKQKYLYTALADASIGSQEQFNFYGVIIDASYPYKSQSRYICTLKVVDHTLYIDDQRKDNNYSMIVIYAKRLEDLPLVRRLGDVIRIHRASIREYKDTKQFAVNVFYNSSWCLFSSYNSPDEEPMDIDGDYDNQSDDDQDMDEETRQERHAEREEKRKYAPYKFSGRSYSFDIQNEKPLLDHIRGWAVDYFGNNTVIHQGMYSLLKNVKQTDQENKEFDLLCKVLKIFEKDENTFELRIKDTSQEMWFMTIPKLKFPNIKQGEIVKIRSVEVNLTSKRNVISVKQSTNILRFHPESKIMREMSKQIEDETDTDKMLLDDQSEVIMSPVIFTEITYQSHQKMPLFKLNDLFIEYEKIPQEHREKNAFKVRFYVLRVDPQDPKEMVQSQCPQCRETKSCKDLGPEGKAKCKDCNVECKLIYKIQFLVKDASSQLNKNFYRLLLYSYEEEKGENFFSDVKPCNLYHNQEALQLIEKQVKILTKFNVWIDGIIERQSTYFLIRDTQVKMNLQN